MRMKTEGFRPDIRLQNRGSVMLLVLFILALSAALVIGMLQLTTEEVLQLRNQIELTRALSVSEAGLNDAYAKIRKDSRWKSGFTDKKFFEDSYTVTVSGTRPNLTLVSTGMTSSGYSARLVAKIRTDDNPPHSITVQSIQINP